MKSHEGDPIIISSFVEKATLLRRQLHQIPEAGFAEFKTQQFILSHLLTLSSDRIQVQTWKTGILVKIQGKNPKTCIAYRTDMDGLPMQEETNYSFQSQHAGYMHACGHDMHMAIALGMINYFTHHPINNDLLFIFQPAEEGPGGALPMMKSTEFQQWRPDVIFALHVAPEYPVGTLATRPGILFANASELFITLTGKSGHAAYPHLANDMTLAAAQLIVQLQSIVARNLSPLDSGVITVGEIHAGTRQNIIAEKAQLAGTIRSLSATSMNKMKARIEALVQGIVHGFNCQSTLDYGAQYCQVTNHEKETHSFVEWVRKNTDYQMIESDITLAGEDFGFFLNEIPGCMFWLGVDTPYGLHHPKMEPDEGAIQVAMDVMIQYIQNI